MRVGLLGVRGNDGGGVGCREEAGRGGERTRTGGSSATPALALREKVTEAPRGARRVLHGMQRDSTWRCHAPPATGSRPPLQRGGMCASRAPNGVGVASEALPQASAHFRRRTPGPGLSCAPRARRHPCHGRGNSMPPPQRLQLLLPLPARVRLSAQTPSFATSTRGAEKRSLQGVWLVPGVRRPAANKHPPVSLENSSPPPSSFPFTPSARGTRVPPPWRLPGAPRAVPKSECCSLQSKAARHPPSPRRPRPAAPHALRPTARN